MNDRTRSREDRSKAQGILDRIERSHGTTSQIAHLQSQEGAQRRTSAESVAAHLEHDYDGTIV